LERTVEARVQVPALPLGTGHSNRPGYISRRTVHPGRTVRAGTRRGLRSPRSGWRSPQWRIAI